MGYKTSTSHYSLISYSLLETEQLPAGFRPRGCVNFQVKIGSCFCIGCYWPREFSIKDWWLLLLFFFVLLYIITTEQAMRELLEFLKKLFQKGMEYGVEPPSQTVVQNILDEPIDAETKPSSSEVPASTADENQENSKDETVHWAGNV